MAAFSHELDRYRDFLARTQDLRFPDCEAPWRWSIDALDAFWLGIWDFFELHSETPFGDALSEDRMPGAPSGRKMELPVKKLLLGAAADQVFKRDAMANAACLGWFEAFAARRRAWACGGPDLQVELCDDGRGLQGDPMSSNDAWYRDLRALRDGAFPKACNCCGRVYESAAAYLIETQAMMQGARGLKSSRDDDGTVIVEVFRNCLCGSTLLSEFANRRDSSPQVQELRERFERLLAQLVQRGLARGEAHAELLREIQGHGSELVRGLMPLPRDD